MGLQKRVECLLQPLNFLLLWSKQRDSCVQQVVLNAQELLFDVCRFVERFAPSQEGVGPSSHHSAPSLGSGGGGSGGAIDSEQLEYYLKELEFACASVSMAVSIARATEPQRCFASCAFGSPRPQAGEDAGTPPSGLSVSALLRASRRIQEMWGRSGDLCACPGRLYARASAVEAGHASAPRVRGRSSSVVDDRIDNALGKAGASGLSTEACSCTSGWTALLSIAMFKVVAMYDPRVRRRRFGISVESRLPLNHEEATAGFTVELGFRPCDEGKDSGLLNTSASPMAFPIEAAVGAALCTSGRLDLPEPLGGTRGVLDLAFDSPVLVWTAPVVGSSVGSKAASPRDGEHVGGTMADAALEGEGGGCHLSDAVLLPDPVRARRQSLSASPRVVSGSSAPANASQFSTGERDYAFVFDSQRGEAEHQRLGEAEVSLTPLDVLYLARLCALDDSHHGLFHSSAGSYDVTCSGELPAGNGNEFDTTSSGGEAACPPHLMSSDEVLMALLQQDGGVRDPIDGHPGAPVAEAGSKLSAQALRGH